MIDDNDFNFRTFEIQDKEMMIDLDAASVFDVDVEEIRQVVRLYPKKYSDIYSIKLSENEKEEICAKWEKEPGHPKVQEKPEIAFSVVGIFMLATTLNSPFAVHWSKKIVEQYARLQALSRLLSDLMESAEDESLDKEELIMECNHLISEIFHDTSFFSHCNDVSIMNIRRVKGDPDMRSKCERAEA